VRPLVAEIAAVDAELRALNWMHLTCANATLDTPTPAPAPYGNAAPAPFGAMSTGAPGGGMFGFSSGFGSLSTQQQQRTPTSLLEWQQLNVQVSRLILGSRPQGRALS